MSVLIKGMEMPKSCCNCPLAKLSPKGETLICNFTLSTVPWDNKPFDCPLVPVPPHGDLIDRDKLLESDPEIREDLVDSDGYCWESEWGYTREQINFAPTIIPAEEADNG